MAIEKKMKRFRIGPFYRRTTSETSWTFSQEFADGFTEEEMPEVMAVFVRVASCTESECPSCQVILDMSKTGNQADLVQAFRDDIQAHRE